MGQVELDMPDWEEFPDVAGQGLADDRRWIFHV